MPLSLSECQQLYDAAEGFSACHGNAKKAKEYFDVKDIEGLERLCRGNYAWLTQRGIKYEMTDGEGEVWRESGTQSSRMTYKGGRLHGEMELFNSDGTKSVKVMYKDGARVR